MSSRRKMSTKMIREIGQRIKAARMTAGYGTSKEFAEDIGLDVLTYRRYERGEVVPDVELLAQMADKTGYSLDWIIAGKGNVRREE